MPSRKRFECLDCKVDTGRIGEFYFLNTELWFSAVGSIHGMLCIGCFERRIGRMLRADDFTAAFINRVDKGTKSARLRLRLQNKPE